MAGFDDAEVMAAVAEIAADARLFEKHRHNAKVKWRYVHRMHTSSRMRIYSTQAEARARVLEQVMDFYTRMGGLVAARCRDA